LAKKKIEIDKLRASVKGYAVAGFFKDTLFVIYNKLGSFSAKDRAAAVSSRIEKLADDFTFNKDSLQVVPSETTTDIIYRDNIIASVSENDAIWENTTKGKLALRYKGTIEKAVLKYKDETSFSTLAKEIGLALLVLLIMGFIIKYLIKLFNWTAQKIDSQKGKSIRGIKIKDYNLFDEDKQVKVLHFFNKFLKWLLIVLVVYLALPVLFGIFPWTKDLTETLFGYVLNPLQKMLSAVWHYIPNLITILVIFFVFKYLIRGVNYLKDEIASGALKLSGFYPDWANPTYQIVKVLLYAFMFVLIFPYLPGSDSPIFQGVSVFLGFLFTFGSAGSLSNVMAGLVLTYMRLFKMGDRVKIGDVTGDVIEKSLLVTRIRTIKNEIISIPNSNVMNSHTINYSSDTDSKGLIMHTTVTIGYDVPWKDMHQALLNAADRTELVLKEPNPFVLQTSLEDFYVSYQINLYTKEANKQATIYSQLHANIQDCCNEVGIEILSPHYRAARDGNTTTIPGNYLPKDYEAPSFRVENTNNK
jgi:small-conductance mechanosensitive channel